MTEADYLAFERAAEPRHELVGGVVRRMPDTNMNHARIKVNTAGEIHGHLRGNDCCVLTSTMRVKVEATDAFVYPDILVVCGEPRLLDAEQDVLLNPAVIVEVMSPESAAYDAGKKFRHYTRIPSLREVVLVAQDEAVVDRFVRQADGKWLLTTLDSLDDELVFESIPARVRLADVYAGVTFPETPPR